MAKARSYKVYYSAKGQSFPSKLAAWRDYDTSGSVILTPPVVETSAPVPPSPTFKIPRVVSPELASLVLALGMSLSDLPSDVVDCVQATRSAGVSTPLKALAADRITLFGRERLSSSGPPLPALPVDSSLITSSAEKEISLLRAELPQGCEARMLGSSGWSHNQLPPSLRAKALDLKFNSMAGRAGANCARNRRALIRYKNFCLKEHVSPHFPVGGSTLLLFVDAAAASSKGSKGGRTVAYSLKTAFVSLKEHNGLEVELDAPVLFNNIKPYKGDSETATSPSPWALSRWCFLAVHAPSPVARLACAVAAIACLLSLRAVHFVGATALTSSDASRIRVNLAKDKDGSDNVWAGCDAEGPDGPLEFWPTFLADALERGYLVPNVTSSKEVTLESSSISSSPVTSAGMVVISKLAFLLLGVSLVDQKAFHLTGHSFRHFFPCIGELFMWLASLRDELGRWATGAANRKRHLCGPRYTVKANQALQIFLRRRALEAVRLILSLPDVQPESAVPDFDSLAACEQIRASRLFGPGAFTWVPEFGAVSS